MTCAPTPEHAIYLLYPIRERKQKKIKTFLRSYLIIIFPMIVSNRTKEHLEPVYLNVYDLLSQYRTINCLFKHSFCHLLGVYHTVR